MGAIAIGIILILQLAGCGRTQTILQQDQTRFPEAVRLYQNGCITCHGNNLQGGIGPNLQHVGSRMTLSAIIHRIEVGAGPMPPYGAKNDAILTPSQIHTLAVWLASKK